ncbi:restriction endonuclease subunit S [Christiangramia echinicola]|uniref:restriction endonuclease subunit S n=1 Tax=Christiangramia echinicola TaxID=279359 RepID=UPI00040FC100|nr:restriction endonuclease subunit S [Christiangramia echinicola]
MKKFEVKRIGDIADIQFGPYIKPDIDGDIRYLLASHFDENITPIEVNDSFVKGNEKLKKFILQSNDVILAGKGHRTFAWANDESMGPVIPSSLFYILRASTDVIIGKYLAAVLNSEVLQHQLEIIGAGVTVTSIPKKELQELEIAVPLIEEQKKFLEVYNLLDKDIELTDKLLKAKRNLKRGVVNELLTNKTKT